MNCVKQDLGLKDTHLILFMTILYLLCGNFVALVEGTNPRQQLTKLASSYNKPEQIHISFGSKPNIIIIMWSSTSDEKSYVEFSSNAQTIKKVDAESSELKEHSENAKKFIHRAELENLVPGTQYTYRIKCGMSGVQSDIFSFTVPHNDLKKSQTFMVLADMGLITKSLHFIVNEAVNTKYEAVFHIGDLAYNLDRGGGKVGDEFMNKIQKFTSVVPYMTTPGDHERFFKSYHYRHRFSTPGAKWPMKEEELWYSIDIGHVHFISINTEALLGKDENKEKQLVWLKDDLIKADQNRKRFPWIIVMGHKPIYCTKSVMEQECEKEFSGLRESLEDLFFEYGVDLILSGHKHCYERSWPIYKSKIFKKSYVDSTAPIYIISGALGYEYLLDGQLSNPDWMAFGFSKKGKELYGRLKIINGTHLIWSVHAASSNEEVDQIHVVKLHHGSFGTPGQVALDKLRERERSGLQLPPEPFKIIEMPPVKIPAVYFGVSRKVILWTGVIALSFFLCIFLRFTKARRICKGNNVI